MNQVRRHQRRLIKMRGIKYRGFTVELYNNRLYGFKFEWKVRVLNPSFLKLTKPWRGRHIRSVGKFQYVMHDPTSWRTRQTAREYGKYRVNELRSPFWYKKP